MAGIDDSRQFLPLRIAVLTVSDTRDARRRQVGRDAVPSASRRPVTWSPTAPSCRMTSPPSGRASRSGSNRSRGRCDHHHRRHRLHRPRRDARGGRALFEKRMDGVRDAVPDGELHARSAPRRSRRARPRAWPARPTSSACRARPAPAGMPGTRFSSTSSTTGTAPAISSRSCRAWTSTCGDPRRKARRSRTFQPPAIMVRLRSITMRPRPRRRSSARSGSASSPRWPPIC